jgi:redox-sensitive bicupin YhaK (pirin superfamily)
MSKSVVKIEALGFPWKTKDPFLFCVHHADFYPKGTKEFGPEPELLKGRNMGSDFEIKDGWRMYHGMKVPGFPSHPHRGFETITINKQGFVDHADSLGGAGRFGKGDVQWMTAGKGVQHSEMFPLLNQEMDNTLEIFQIWLNLPKKGKFVEPYYKMIWNETIPIKTVSDKNGRKSWIDVIAGSFEGTTAPEPTPDSWAANADNDIAVWTIKMEAGAELSLPVATAESNRTIYLYQGNSVSIDGQEVLVNQMAELVASAETLIVNGSEETFLLLLQGKPINEPVAQYGPFVMNTQAEIMQAYNDYQRTHFGGWPWDNSAPVHDPKKGRFAKYSDGSVETP